MNLRVISAKLSRIMVWLFHLFWILPLCVGTLITVIEDKPTAVINWHKDNPLFKEGGAKLELALSSNLIIKCPENVQEYYKIYWVSKAEFEKCTKLPNSSLELLVNCNNPERGISFTQEIADFSSVPYYKDFRAGQSYYITTFSSGTELGISNEYEGACKDLNMKLNLTVRKSSTTHPTQGPTNETKATTPRETTPTPRPTPSTSPTTRTTTKRTTPQQTTPRITTHKPHPTDIPDPTDIVINVPDNGNTGTIVADAATSVTYSWALLPCLGLSLLHILNNAHIAWMVR